MRKKFLASVCLAILALSIVSILLPTPMKVPTVQAQLADNWFVASSNAVFGYPVSGTTFTNLSYAVPGGFNFTSWWGTYFIDDALTITCVASGNGYYLVGLDQPTDNQHWPQYSNPISTPHLYKYDGDTWQPVGGSTLNTVQITSIHKYQNQFIIAGWYMGFGWETCYGRVFTYDGSTLTDITTDVLGSTHGPIVTEVCDLGSSVLFGEYDAGSTGHPSLVTWNGTNAETVFQNPSTVYYGFTGYYPRLTSIAYNGQYALFGTSVDADTLEQFFPSNGTINALSWTGTVDSMGWNGTDFLISGNGGTKLFNGSQFSTVDAGDYNTMSWNGAFFLLGSGTKLAKCDDFETISPNVGFTIVDICPNIIQLLVTADPVTSVAFQALGGNMMTPVTFPMSLGGEVHFVVPDKFTNTAPQGMYYNFDHAIYSHDGINETIPDPVEFDVTVGSDSNVTLFYTLETLPTPTHGGGFIDQLNATYTVDVTVLANKTEAYGAMVLFGQQSASTDYIGHCSFRNIQAGTYHLTITYYDPITSQNLRYDNDITVNKDMQITVDLLLQTLTPKTTFYFPWWLILLLIIIAMIVVYIAYHIRNRNSHRSSGRRRRR